MFQTADDVEWNTNHAQPCSEPSQVWLMSVPRQPGVNAVFCAQAHFGLELFTSVNSLTDRFCCCPQSFCRCLSACFFFFQLGRRYVTTPSHLDHLRDNFTLYVAMVTSYQLGSAGVKAMSKGQEPPLLLKLAEKCMKLQHLLVTMNERVCDIEQCLRDDGDGDQAK